MWFFVKITNFQLVETRGCDLSDSVYVGTVDIETGLFFKKKKTVGVYRRYGDMYRYLENGKYAPSEVYLLAHAYSVREGKKC